jgi:CRISPR-associated protein Csd2
MNTIYTDATKRHDFAFLFDATDSNPNGDPDAGNLPRTDPETLQGLVTDVCIKRKVRDYVDMIRGTEDRYKIYVQNRGIALNVLHARAYTARNLVSTGAKQKREDVEQARSWMCENFFDIRCFGAVMNTQINCGQVRGPVQLTFARSIDPIVPLDLAITRVAVTQVGADKQTEIGRKAIVPYALYLGYGYYILHFAKQTGFTGEDLEVFWEALQGMWDLDRAAGRSNIALQKLYVFSHQNPLGNAPAHKLFERISIKRTSSW